MNDTCRRGGGRGSCLGLSCKGNSEALRSTSDRNKSFVSLNWENYDEEEIIASY